MPTSDQTNRQLSGVLTNRWSVLAGAWATYLVFGLLVGSTGALVPSIRDDLELSDSEMGLVLGAWQLVYIFTSIPAGRVIDRIGLRRSLAAALVIMAASGLGRAMADGFVTLFLAVGLLGLGGPIVSISSPKVAASLFEGRDRRLAVGIYSTAPGIGGVLGLFLPANVIGPYVGDNWRSIIVVLTGVAGIAFAVWIAVSRSVDAMVKPGEGSTLAGYRAMASLPIVRFVMLISALNFFIVHGVGHWIVAILTDVGWSEREAGLWGSVGRVFGLLMSFTLPRLATPERRRSLMIGALVCNAVALSALLTTNPFILLPAILVSTGARVALMPILAMILMDSRSVGPTRLAAATGLYFTTAQVGGVAGPAATGWLADVTESFRVPLGMHAAVAVGIVMILLVSYKRATAESTT